MDSNTIDTVVADDVVLELETISIDEGADTGDTMGLRPSASPRRDVGH